MYGLPSASASEDGWKGQSGGVALFGVRRHRDQVRVNLGSGQVRMAEDGLHIGSGSDGSSAIWNAAVCRSACKVAAVPAC